MRKSIITKWKRVYPGEYRSSCGAFGARKQDFDQDWVLLIHHDPNDPLSLGDAHGYYSTLRDIKAQVDIMKANK